MNLLGLTPLEEHDITHMEAAIVATKEISLAVLATAISLVIAFVPIASLGLGEPVRPVSTRTLWTQRPSPAVWEILTDRFQFSNGNKSLAGNHPDVACLLASGRSAIP